MVYQCKCELFAQIFVGGYTSEGMSVEEIEVVINRCSVVKCKHVYKPRKVAGFTFKKQQKLLISSKHTLADVIHSARRYQESTSRKRYPTVSKLPMICLPLKHG